MSTELKLENRPVSHAWPVPVYAESFVQEQQLILDTATYAAGDTLADLFPVVFPESWKVAIFHEVFVLDEDDQGIAFDLLFFRAKPTISAKNAVWTTADAEMRSCIGYARVTSGDYVDLGANRVAEISNLARFFPIPATGLLWVGTVSQGAGTYTAAGVRVKLGFLR